MTSRPASAPGLRRRRTGERREAIVAAAAEEFVARGFDATRIEDVAARAGVAKGTIYLHFRDKTALFEGVVQAVLVEPFAKVRAMEPAAGESTRAFLDRTLAPLLSDLARSRRGDVIRLLIGEGARFPELAESYHRAVIAPGVALIRAMAERAVSRGEPGGERLARLPQLLVAPALLAMIWARLFQPFDPLDPEALIAAQLDLLLGPADCPSQTGSVDAISIPKPDRPT